MALTPGQAVTAANDNNAFISKTVDSTTVAKIDLNNSDVASGARVTNTQGYLNELADTVGQTGNYLDANRKNYSSNEIIADGDNRKVALEKLDAEFNSSTGHAHSGAAGDGAQVSAGNLANFNKYFAQWASFVKTGITGTSTVVTTEMAAKNPGGSNSSIGVVTTAPNNKVIVLDNTTGEGFEDGSGRKVFARISESSGVWTLSYLVNISGTETAYSFGSSTDITFHLIEVYDQNTRPTIPSTPEFGSLNLTADIVNASSSQRGLVSTGSQQFAGAKQFVDTTSSTSHLTGSIVTDGGLGVLENINAGGTIKNVDTTQSTTKDTGAIVTEGGLGVEKNITAGGTVTGSNLSGTNTGDVTLGTFGSTPSASGASLSGQAITLQPADATNPGGISTATQTIPGRKNFAAAVSHDGEFYSSSEASTITGTNATLALPTKQFVRLTNSGLVSISTITAPSADYQYFWIRNVTGNDISIVNGDSGATSILTGTGSDFVLKNKATAMLVYDFGASRWSMMGGGGSGSGSTYPVDINYISNFHFEVDATGWVTYADAASATPTDGTAGTANTTIARTTTTPLRNVGSLLMTKNTGASRQGEGFSYDFSIDDSDKGKVLQGSFEYLISSGTFVDNDLSVWIYDRTNNVMIQPAPYLLKNSTLVEKFGFEFQTAINSNLYRLIIHIGGATNSNLTMRFDNFFVGPSAKLYGSPITDWISYTPTFGGTGVSIGNGTITGRYRRVGDSIDVSINLVTGTTTAYGSGFFNFSLPAGLSIDTAKMVNSSSLNSIKGLARAFDSSFNGGFGGKVTFWNPTNLSANFDFYNTHAGLNPIRFDNNGGVAAGFPFAWATGDAIELEAYNLPIAGWGSSVLMSQDASTRIVSARFKGTTEANIGSIANLGTAIMRFDILEKDTHGSYNTSNGVYTIPVSGTYRISTYFSVKYQFLSPAQSGGYYVDVTKNGVFATRIANHVFGSSNHTLASMSGSGTFEAVAGDLIRITIFNNTGQTVQIEQNTNSNFALERISGPSQIAAVESVFAAAKNTGGFSSAHNTVVQVSTGWTIDENSHNAMAATTAIFTAPVNGIYLVHLQMVYQTNATGVRAPRIRKNGADVNYVEYPGNASIPTTTVNHWTGRLLQGDTVQAASFQNSGAALNVLPDGNYNKFTVIKVGN